MALLCLLFSTSFAQTVYNPFTQNIHFTPEPTATGFECGTTQYVEFTQGITTVDSATQWAIAPLLVKITLQGFVFSGSALSNVSGTYASHFSWAYDPGNPQCIIGTQINSLPGTGSNPMFPDTNASGKIKLKIQVPNVQSGTVLHVNAQLFIPSYMASYNSIQDDIETTQTQTYCQSSLCQQAPKIVMYPNHQVCIGDNMILHASIVPGANIQWAFPSGSQGVVQTMNEISEVRFNSISSLDNGTYIIHQSIPGCSTTLHDTLVVQSAEAPAIQSVVSNCNNGQASIDVNAMSNLPLEYSLNGSPFQLSSHFAIPSDSRFVMSVRPIGSGCVTHYEGACLNCNTSPLCGIQQQDSLVVPTWACGQNSIPITVYFSAGTSVQLMTAGNGVFTVSNLTSSPSISYYQPSADDRARGYVIIQSMTNDPDGAGPCVSKICSKTIQLLNGLVPPTIISNLPICEYGYLELTAVGAKGNIQWSGPQNLLADGRELHINQASLLMSGIYTASANAFGCNSTSSSDTIDIHPLPNLQMNAIATPEYCAGSANGSVQVQVANGSGNYTICQSSTSMNCVNGNSAVFSYLAPGNYAIQVTDLVCPDTSFTINALVNPGTSPSPPQVLSLQQVCEHEPILFNGVTNLTNTLLWVNAATGFSFAGTTSIAHAMLSDNGIYYAKAIDGNGCASSQVSMQVIVNPMPVIQNINVTCQGTTADIDILASNIGAALTYSIDGINFQSSNVFTGLNGASYTVYVKSLNGNCTAQQQVNVPNCACGQQANITLEAPIVSCGLTAIPLKAVFANSLQGTWSSDGNGMFSNINGSSPLVVNYQPTVSDISKGVVVFTFMTNDPDAGGPCVSESKFVRVELKNQLPVPEIQSVPPLCEGDTLQIWAQQIFSNSEWRNSLGQWIHNDSLKIDSLVANQGGYYVVKNSGNGCTPTYDTSFVQVSAAPNLQITTATIPEACEGQGNGQIQFYVQGGSNEYVLQYGHPTQSLLIDTNAALKWMTAGQHEFYISDKNCPNATHSVNVNLPQGFHVDIPTNVTSNSPVCAGDMLWLHASPTSGGSILWSNPDWGYTSSDSLSSINNSSTIMQGRYFVQQELNGCHSAKVELPVRIIELPEFIGIDTHCFGDSDGGELRIHATVNALDTLEYALNDGAFQTSNVFDHMTNGRYQLHLRVKGSQCETIVPNVEFYCHCECGKESPASIFPNPSQGKFTLHFEQQEVTDDAILILYDLNGAVQLKQDINVQSGMNSVSVNAAHLAKGLYKAVLYLNANIELLTVEIQ